MSNDRPPAELESDFAAVARVASGAGSQATTLTTLLHIGGEHVDVLCGRGQPGALQGLPAGREAAATLLVLREFMHHRGHTAIVVVGRPDTAAG